MRFTTHPTMPQPTCLLKQKPQNSLSTGKHNVHWSLLLNPLSANKDGMYGLLIRHPCLRWYFSPQWTILTVAHFTRNIKAQMNPYCAKSLKLAIIWCHRVEMALTGLNQYTVRWQLHTCTTSLCVVLNTNVVNVALNFLIFLGKISNFPQKY